ncbi:MAG: PTS sugar transporter subunit IIA [Erysipelotrichaceae bacterium]|nr:PTS sugar transporter subunit IIA [Erysipelotrichaceae bacterium]
MIGIIVCGHSSFASGIYSAYELIAGACDHLKTIDFTIDDSIAMLEKKMNQAIDSLNDCDDILFMVDLLQGTPYFCAMKVAKQYPSKNIRVIAGTNLAMIIECSMARAIANDIDSLVDMIINTGKEQMVKY